MVLLRLSADNAGGKSGLRQIMSAEDLARCKGDVGSFLKMLGEKGGEFGLVVKDGLESEGKGRL